MDENANSGDVNVADRIDVAVPLRSEYFATLRTVAATLGADAGFTIDEIDDLRLAISEVVSSLDSDASSAGRRVTASFGVTGDGLDIVITTDGPRVPVALDDLATSILRSVVDRYEIVDGTVHLVKLATEATDASEDATTAP